MIRINLSLNCFIGKKICMTTPGHLGSLLLHLESKTPVISGIRLFFNVYLLAVSVRDPKAVCLFSNDEYKSTGNQNISFRGGGIKQKWSANFLAYSAGGVHFKQLTKKSQQKVYLDVWQWRYRSANIHAKGKWSYGQKRAGHTCSHIPRLSPLSRAHRYTGPQGRKFLFIGRDKISWLKLTAWRVKFPWQTFSQYFVLSYKHWNNVNREFF